MKIGLYEDWMEPQVSKLFSIEYGISEKEFSQLRKNFYEHIFQKSKAIRIVATDGNKVLGFQSFFYWPYQYNEKIYNSYQSGNSLVHQDYRGKGIFQKLLDYIETEKDQFKIDFFIGFPIDKSVGSLVRNKWTNLLNLQWNIKLISIRSFFTPINHEKMDRTFPYRAMTLNNTNNDYFKLWCNPDFTNWKKKLYENTRYYSYYYEEGNEKIIFQLKINIRKKLIKELIVGDISTTTNAPELLQNAFSDFLRKASKSKAITLVSIAHNAAFKYNLNQLLAKLGFFKIDKKIFFCLKSFINDDVVNDKKNWCLYRSDIDTW